MESQVCVNCLNKKPINSTTNRLVTESCGHVKCMDCLLHEKAGCVACVEENSPKEPEDTRQPSKGPPSNGCNVDHGPVHTEFPLKHFLLERDTENEVQTDYYCEKKKKLETSHIRIETDGNLRSYYCTMCNKKFQARSQVAYHAYCNGQRKPYQCPECSKSFATHSHFKYHMRVHRNERTYACELCGEGFFQMSKLQRHKLKHTKEKKYQCTECKKAFNNLTSLRKHGLTHSDERPYGCATCGRRFRDSSNYRKHVAKHTGGGCAPGRRLRAHQCPRCPQAFAARKDMRRHAAVHTDSKPFRCKVCSRRFRRKDNLERHVRNTHPEHAPAAAVACDTPAAPAAPARLHDDRDGSRLRSRNPLPPLPPELLRDHLREDAEPEPEPEPEPGKSVAERILEANVGRRSVIFGPVRARAEPAEYVHKMRRAHAARPPPPALPPVDARQLRRLAQLAHQNELDVGAPPEKFRELYKKILYERPAAEPEPAPREDVHWRKKMKLAVNWSIFNYLKGWFGKISIWKEAISIASHILYV